MTNTKIMGVLNVTPDSFSDGGMYSSYSQAIIRAQQIIGEGADIIDIGGQSTRPGSLPITLQEELDRVIPVIEYIKKETDATISIDSFMPEVTEEALKKGASIINDITGFTNKGMQNLVATWKPSCVIMHMQGKPQTMQENPHYNNLIKEIQDFLFTQADLISELGAKKIFIDPGFVFGKTAEDNYRLLKKLSSFKKGSYEILVGMSRKSMINAAFNSLPQDRLSGTIALHTIAMLNGANIIRVHDVKEAVQAKKVTQMYLES